MSTAKQKKAMKRKRTDRAEGAQPISATALEGYAVALVAAGTCSPAILSNAVKGGAR